MDERTFQELLVEPQLIYSKTEALALWKYLEHEHIPYEDLTLLEAVRKLSRFIDKISE